MQSLIAWKFMLLVGLSLVIAEDWPSSSSSRYDDKDASSNGASKNCYKELRQGLKLKDSHVDSDVSVDSLWDCEKECSDARFSCASFSYRKSASRYDRNCLLSREHPRTLDPNDYRDFDRNRDYDFFLKVDCYDRDRGSYRDDGWSYRGRDDSNCFEQTKSKSRVRPNFVRVKHYVKTREDCERRCIQAKDFTCRSFNYRLRDGVGYYSDNCELSSDDDLTLHQYDDFINDSQYDFYLRKRYDKDCQDRNSYYGDDRYDRYDRYDRNDRYEDDKGCTRMHKDNYALNTRVTYRNLDVRTMADCKRECLRDNKCETFSYNSYRRMCQLSDKISKILYDWDMERDSDSVIYRRTSCYGRDDDFDDNRYSGFGGYNDREYTVSGFKCYRRECERDPKLGSFWRCDIDADGSWDYCCRDRCGRSKGFNSELDFPWCYVGIDNNDQWRPCKESSSSGYRSYLHEREVPENDTKASDPPPPPKGVTPIQVVDMNRIRSGRKISGPTNEGSTTMSKMKSTVEAKTKPSSTTPSSMKKKNKRSLFDNLILT